MCIYISIYIKKNNIYIYIYITTLSAQSSPEPTAPHMETAIFQLTTITNTINTPLFVIRLVVFPKVYWYRIDYCISSDDNNSDSRCLVPREGGETTRFRKQPQTNNVFATQAHTLKFGRNDNNGQRRLTISRQSQTSTNIK